MAELPGLAVADEACQPLLEQHKRNFHGTSASPRRWTSQAVQHLAGVKLAALPADQQQEFVAQAFQIAEQL